MSLFLDVACHCSLLLFFDVRCCDSSLLTVVVCHSSLSSVCLFACLLVCLFSVSFGCGFRASPLLFDCILDGVTIVVFNVTVNNNQKGLVVVVLFFCSVVVVCCCCLFDSMVTS